MADIHDVLLFSSEGERILGIVIEHYTNPLDDFYVVYADYALHKVSNPKEDASVIQDNVIIPALDEALFDFKLKKQHLTDVEKHHKDIETIISAIKSRINIGTFFNENT